MRFGVLGPLEVRTADGTPVRVAEVKVRALLAHLLAHRGQAVSTGRLIDDLWVDRVPANPTGALQTKVSQLRRALEDAEPGGRDIVVSSPPGYLLRISADAVDMGRFAALATRARASGDPRERLAMLADALAIWRGPAFADFGDEEFAQPAIQRLEEQRLVALEDQVEVRLELGEHRELVGELGDLVARYPQRERLLAAHLRALYGAGRQGDALASYVALRDRLAEELGLDPGPELVALHQAILRHDPALVMPPRLAVAHRVNMPAPLTDLVGRTGAVDEIRSLINASRLVTLTGPGGVGKTRLAVEAATQAADTFPDGVWLVELSGHPQGEGPDAVCSLADVVIAVLGIRHDVTARQRSAAGQRDPIDRLAEALHAKKLMLVIDNCEHMIEPVADLAERLLHAAAGLQVLATSREPLGPAGEAIWTVPPLELPARTAGADPAIVQRFGAVELFVARAAATAPGFALNPDNAEAVAEICRRLDGIPLALELAATRVRALGVHELVERLDDRFELLASGHRGAPARQKSLRAMIDWSWELLSKAEQVVLRRLAVHAGSWTLKAAEAVCAGEGMQVSEILDLLARLVDRSLVDVIDSDGARRYRLLESVSAYCVERLQEAGELDRVRTRYHRFYLELAELTEPQLHGHDQRLALKRLDLEAANLRAALAGAARQRAADIALRLVNALAWYWFLRGRLGEGHSSMSIALSAEDGELAAAVRTQALTWRAGFAILLGDGTDLADQAQKALTLYGDIEDPGGRARAAWFLSLALSGSGDLSIHEDRVEEARIAFHTLGDSWGLAAALSTHAAQAQARGDLAAAKRDGEHSAALFRQLGDLWGELKATDVLSSLAEITGDYEQATRLHQQGLYNAEELGLSTEASYKLSGLGRIALLKGDYAQSEELHRRAMRLAAEGSHKRGEQFAEVGLGLVARRQGKLEIAEAHLSMWLNWCRQADGDMGAAFILAELGFIAEQRGDAEAALALHLDGFSSARATGDPRAVALALEGLAGATAAAGQHNQAAQLLGAASAARLSVMAPLAPAERGDVHRITMAATAALGQETFSAEFERGQTTAPDDARSAIMLVRH